MFTALSQTTAFFVMFGLLFLFKELMGVAGEYVSTHNGGLWMDQYYQSSVAVSQVAVPWEER
jgi:hypothetical protein